MEQRFQELLREKGIDLSPRQLQQFHTYYEQLIEWNKKMNLTAITEKEAVYLKHFYDSLTLGFYYDFSQPLSVCDVGAGAGFPSLPLKICFPNIEVTIVDSLNKRIHFLKSLIDTLGLENVNVYHARAEKFARKTAFRASFDIVIARAVAKLSVLSEYCLPLVCLGGHFFAMKGPNIETELEDAGQAINLLGGTVGSVESLAIPRELDQRHIVHVRKQSETPSGYPRKPGKPNKNPL